MLSCHRMSRTRRLAGWPQQGTPLLLLVSLATACGDGEASNPGAAESSADAGRTAPDNERSGVLSSDPDPLGADDDGSGATETNVACVVSCEDDTDCEYGSCRAVGGSRCCLEDLPLPDADGGVGAPCDTDRDCADDFECAFPDGEEQPGECMIPDAG